MRGRGSGRKSISTGGGEVHKKHARRKTRKPHHFPYHGPCFRRKQMPQLLHLTHSFTLCALLQPQRETLKRRKTWLGAAASKGPEQHPWRLGPSDCGRGWPGCPWPPQMPTEGRAALSHSGPDAPRPWSRREAHVSRSPAFSSRPSFSDDHNPSKRQKGCDSPGWHELFVSCYFCLRNTVSRDHI